MARAHFHLAIALCCSIAMSGAAFAYGGGLGPTERDANGNWTDYRNPQADPPPNPAVPGGPRRYHVTVCSDNTWYGAWVPPEWKGLADKPVRTDPSGKGQNHGYAKGGDGTEGGLQVMGGGTGSWRPDSTWSGDISLAKDGVTIVLNIRVIHCPGAQPYDGRHPKGRVMAAAGGPKATTPMLKNDKAVVPVETLQPMKPATPMHPPPQQGHE